MKPLRTASGLLFNARLATMDGADYGLIDQGVLVWHEGLITYVGNDRVAAENINHGQVLDAEGACVTPALVDCHTHLVFAGNRAIEAEQRLRGVRSQRPVAGLCPASNTPAASAKMNCSHKACRACRP
jgi:imidazolonepropionase